MVEVPAGLKLMTQEFREGWTFVTGDASQVEKKIRAGGWSFIKIADPSLRSGIGETSPEAIASALALALRRIRENFRPTTLWLRSLTVRSRTPVNKPT